MGLYELPIHQCVTYSKQRSAHTQFGEAERDPSTQLCMDVDMVTRNKYFSHIKKGPPHKFPLCHLAASVALTVDVLYWYYEHNCTVPEKSSVMDEKPVL